MDSLSVIFLGIGFVALLMSLLLLLLKLLKGKNKISSGIVLLLVVGFISISAGIGLMVPNVKGKIVSVASKEEVLTLADEPTSEGETGTALSNETEPLKIARDLVEKEMAKQVGLKKWAITEHNITSENDVYNIADYDKPVGDMRKVWIAGYVKATAADDGSTGSVGYTLELYQMKGDNKWYIGKHWGVLANLKVTEKPVVNEDGLELSDSDELPMPKGEKPVNGAKPEQTALTEDDLKGAWHWNEYYMIFRNDFTYSYIEKNAEFVAEGTYTVDQLDDHFKVIVKHTTGQYDSVMTIKLIDINHLEANEDGNSWKAERLNIAEVEDILTSLKGKQ